MPEFVDLQVLAEGLMFPEGPVVLADGSLIFAEIRAGRLSRLDVDGQVRPVAITRGGPNGVARGPDGALYVCNNGGRADRIPPCIQRVDPATGLARLVELVP